MVHLRKISVACACGWPPIPVPTGTLHCMGSNREESGPTGGPETTAFPVSGRLVEAWPLPCPAWSWRLLRLPLTLAAQWRGPGAPGKGTVGQELRTDSPVRPQTSCHGHQRAVGPAQPAQICRGVLGRLRRATLPGVSSLFTVCSPRSRPVCGLTGHARADVRPELQTLLSGCRHGLSTRMSSVLPQPGSCCPTPLLPQASPAWEVAGCPFPSASELCSWADPSLSLILHS